MEMVHVSLDKVKPVVEVVEAEVEEVEVEEQEEQVMAHVSWPHVTLELRLWLIMVRDVKSVRLEKLQTEWVQSVLKTIVNNISSLIRMVRVKNAQLHI